MLTKEEFIKEHQEVANIDECYACYIEGAMNAAIWADYHFDEFIGRSDYFISEFQDALLKGKQ